MSNNATIRVDTAKGERQLRLARLRAQLRSGIEVGALYQRWGVSATGGNADYKRLLRDLATIGAVRNGDEWKLP